MTFCLSMTNTKGYKGLVYTCLNKQWDNSKISVPNMAIRRLEDKMARH